MKKESTRYAALVFLVIGLIGMICEEGPKWARYTLLSLGILIFLLTYLNNSKK